MKLVLVIGNSHAGAWKSGVSALQGDTGDYEFHFAALARNAFDTFRVSDGLISCAPSLKDVLARTYAHGDTIPLAKYDHVLYVEGLSRLDSRLYTHRRVFPSYSEEVVRSVVNHGGHRAGLYTELLRELGDPRRMLFAGAPLPSEMARDPRLIPKFESPSEVDAAIQIAQKVRRICKESWSDPETARVLLPPPEILTDSGFNTRDQFIRGGLRFDGRARTKSASDYEIDNVHGNAEYGVQMVRTLLEALS